MYDICHYVLSHVTPIKVTWHFYMIFDLNSGCMEACWVSTLSFASPLHCWTDVHSLASPSEMPPRLHWALSTLFPYNNHAWVKPSYAPLQSWWIISVASTGVTMRYSVIVSVTFGNSHQSKGRIPVSCPLRILFRPLKAHLNSLLHKIY